MGHCQSTVFCHAVDQNIGFGIGQQTVLNGITPVIVMRDSPQRCLDTAQHHRHSLEEPLDDIGIDQAGSIGALTCHGSGGIGIITTDLTLGSIVVDHGIHVTCGDPKEEFGASQSQEVLVLVPIRLRDHTNFEA